MHFLGYKKNNLGKKLFKDFFFLNFLKFFENLFPYKKFSKNLLFDRKCFLFIENFLNINFFIENFMKVYFFIENFLKFTS